MTKLATMAAEKLLRSKQLGYSQTPIFRGEASGVLPQSYPKGAFFSRDYDTAAGFAQRGGFDAPREFRLNLSKAFSDAKPVSIEAYDDLVQAMARQNPKFAAEMVDMVAPGKSVEWFAKARQHNPGLVVAENGATVRAMLEQGATDSVGLFRRAGFDALDYGRDIQKIGGEGIRLASAKFDPRMAGSQKITAGLAGAGATGALAAGSQQAEAGQGPMIDDTDDAEFAALMAELDRLEQGQQDTPAQRLGPLPRIPGLPDSPAHAERMARARPPAVMEPAREGVSYMDPLSNALYRATGSMPAVRAEQGVRNVLYAGESLGKEFTGLPAMYRGGKSIMAGIDEGSAAKIAGGATEATLGALPWSSGGRVVAPALRAATKTAPRTIATGGAAGFMMGLPSVEDAATAADESAGDDLMIRAIGDRADLRAMYDEVRRLETLSRQNVSGRSRSESERIRANYATQANQMRQALMSKIGEKGLAESEKAAADKRANAPFRERYPGAAEAIGYTAAGVATALPFANTAKHRLGNALIGKPGLNRTATSFESALAAGEYAKAALAQDELRRRLAAYKSATSPTTGAKKFATNAGLSSLLAFEGSAVPEQVDALAFPPGHPTRENARNELTRRGYYEERAPAAALTGLMTSALGTKAGQMITPGRSSGAIARAESLVDVGTTGSRTRVKDLAAYANPKPPRGPRQPPDQPPRLPGDGPAPTADIAGPPPAPPPATPPSRPPNRPPIERSPREASLGLPHKRKITDQAIAALESGKPMPKTYHVSKSKDVTPEKVKKHVKFLQNMIDAAGITDPKQAAKFLRAMRAAGVPLGVAATAGGVAALNDE